MTDEPDNGLCDGSLNALGDSMKYLLMFFFCLLTVLLSGANLYNIPSPVKQPDGTVLQLLASGDEYANRLHDEDGYTIIQSPIDGYYYYAELRNGEPAPSVHRADSSDPRALGINPGIRVSKETYKAKKQFMNSHSRAGIRGPNTGTVNNIVVYIRFSDQAEFDIPRSVFDAKFNAEGDDAISLRNYFHKASYNQLNYVSHHYPVCSPQINLSYQDVHPRDYYVPYNSSTNPQGYYGEWQRVEREQALLANAIAAIADQVPAELNIDADHDGYVDNVCFIIRGPHTAWADLLWAHRWALYNENAYINNKQVWDFTFQTEDHNDVNTLCHEMFHSVGAPDLYHYEHDGLTPAGCWDLMESGFGHMGMYMKHVYGGWIDGIPEITSLDTYTLNPVTSATNNCFQMSIPDSDETLVFEYRKNDSDIFEANLPGSGLLIYRINSYLEGNSDGPPDEVYIFRPDGNNMNNGRLAEAAFCLEEQRTVFNSFSNPQACLSDGSPFNVNIVEIGSAGETISFRLAANTEDSPPTIQSLVPSEGTHVPNSSFAIAVDVTPTESSIERVEFFFDEELLGEDLWPPYIWMMDEDNLTLGSHEISVVAWQQNGTHSTKTNQIEIIDPCLLNWFDYVTSDPEWEAFGRGAVPIKVAVEMDLGDQDYRVHALRFQMALDTWGDPYSLGMVYSRINRFADGAITDEVLMDLGYCYNIDYSPDFTTVIQDTTTISGQIAVILEFEEYQNIIFDNNAICGHTWITEPGRPWTDALARGIIGAADIRLQLQAPTSATVDPLVPAANLNLSNSPNPFVENTYIHYTLKDNSIYTISIYNLKGQKIRSLVQGKGQAGNFSAIWDGKDDSGKQAASGVYLYCVITGNQSATRRMVLIR